MRPQGTHFSVFRILKVRPVLYCWHYNATYNILPYTWPRFMSVVPSWPLFLWHRHTLTLRTLDQHLRNPTETVVRGWWYEIKHDLQTLLLSSTIRNKYFSLFIIKNGGQNLHACRSLYECSPKVSIISRCYKIILLRWPVRSVEANEIKDKHLWWQPVVSTCGYYMYWWKVKQNTP